MAEELDPQMVLMFSIDQFTTTRLDAQRMALEHFPGIHRLHTDPLVMKTLSADGNVMSDEATRKHLQRCSDHWDQHGFGLWVFRARADGQFIGRGGLVTYQIDGGDVVGLAYAVLSDHWNQGFATEMAEASLRFGFQQFGLSEVASWTLPVNEASQRMMAKLGFKYERDFEFAGLGHRFYRLTKDGWDNEQQARTNSHPGCWPNRDGET